MFYLLNFISFCKYMLILALIHVPATCFKKREERGDKRLRKLWKVCKTPVWNIPKVNSGTDVGSFITGTLEMLIRSPARMGQSNNITTRTL